MKIRTWYSIKKRFTLYKISLFYTTQQSTFNYAVPEVPANTKICDCQAVVGDRNLEQTNTRITFFQQQKAFHPTAPDFLSMKNSAREIIIILAAENISYLYILRSNAIQDWISEASAAPL